MGKSIKGGGSSSSGTKDGMIEIDPQCIRFTHARIRPFFTGCGRRIEDTLADIIEGKMSVNELPKITVILNEGTYFSLNNRRLYVLKELRCKGLLKGNVIKARLKVALEREKDKYKIERCSLLAKIMKENAVENKGEAIEDGCNDSYKSDYELNKEMIESELPPQIIPRDYFSKDPLEKTLIRSKSSSPKEPEVHSSKNCCTDGLVPEMKKINIKKKKGSSKRNNHSDEEI